MCFCTIFGVIALRKICGVQSTSVSMLTTLKSDMTVHIYETRR